MSEAKVNKKLAELLESQVIDMREYRDLKEELASGKPGVAERIMNMKKTKPKETKKSAKEIKAEEKAKETEAEEMRESLRSHVIKLTQSGQIPKDIYPRLLDNLKYNEFDIVKGAIEHFSKMVPTKAVTAKKEVPKKKKVSKKVVSEMNKLLSDISSTRLHGVVPGSEMEKLIREAEHIVTEHKHEKHEAKEYKPKKTGLHKLVSKAITSLRKVETILEKISQI